jgi:predicted PurR-regulated permease PerM
MNDPAHGASDLPVAGLNRVNWAERIVAIGVVLAFFYFAEWELVVTLVSILLAFILAPVVDLLQRFRLARGVAALLAVFLLVAVAYSITYFSYNQANAFVEQMPRYSGKLTSLIARVKKRTERLDDTTRNVLQTKRAGENQAGVSPGDQFTEFITRNFGSVSHAVLLLSFVPFLVYFMLTWEHHVRAATVMLFSMENRHAAHTTLGLMSAMIRSFIVGNFLVGLFIAGLSTAAFAAIHLPFSYVVGVMSGFLSLVPYLGVLLAMMPPLIVGIDRLESANLLIIVGTVLGLHLFGINVLYPKFLGSRLQLNPLAVTLSLLFWGWLWGPMGLVLAIPLTGAVKIIFDHIESLRPYGVWLGE